MNNGYVYACAMTEPDVWEQDFHEGAEMGPKNRQTAEPAEPQTPEPEEQDLNEDPAEVAMRENEQRQAAPPEPPPAPPAPEPPPVARQQALRPSELQVALLHHGKLNGRERTEDLERLKAQYGAAEVSEATAKLMQHGLLDAGQVLTAKGKAAIAGLNPE
jgi:hypothetical protein